MANHDSRHASSVHLVLIGALIVALVAVALFLESEWESRAPVSVAVAATGVIAFFGLILVTGGISDVLADQARMRGVIAASFVVVYFVLLGLLVFFTSDEDAPSITDTLVTNFTVLMGVIIAFYFGGTTLERVRLGAHEDSGSTGAENATTARSGSSSQRD